MRQLHVDQTHLRNARRLARDLEPEARSFLRTDAGKHMLASTEWSRDLAAMAPSMRLANLHGVFVFEASGLWFAEAVFKRMPPYVGDTFGTFPLEPATTRDEAVEAAKALLSVVIACEQGMVKPDPVPVFMLEGVAVSFYRADLDRLETPPDDLTVDALQDVLTTALEEHFADGFTQAGFEALAEDDKTMVNACLGYLLRQGVTAFARPGKDTSRIKAAA